MYPPSHHPDSDGLMYDGGCATQIDQPTQQGTQLESQTVAQAAIDAHLWGFLIPCSIELRRIDFSRLRPTYQIGRNANEGFGNDCILPGMKISNKHCTVTWDGQDKRNAAVRVLDLSSNGTFINGEKIGKGRYGVLREGNEIAFGTAQPQPGSPEDYRFIYRHLAAGPPTEGLYAHYDVTEELGKGSFATVMKAMSKETGGFYAVKMIQINHVRTSVSQVDASGARTKPDPALALHKEVKILERLKHPNICQLKEVFYEEHYINIVLEWVPGGDLLEYILKRNGLSEEESCHITYQLCDALAYIHSQGIAHRDLKPENVLLTLDEPPQVKVADFGLAKAIDSLTMLRTMCGTPSYLAPEVVQQNGNEGYQQVVDSWSVGVIVFSMMTSSSPFVEPSYVTDVKVRILERKIDWEPLIQMGVSEAGLHFVKCLLEDNPEVRMTLTDALMHPWLAPCRPANMVAPGGAIMDDITCTASQIMGNRAMWDVSMREPFSDCSQPESRVIQRRRKVIDDAREAGRTFEPAPGMLEKAQLEQQREGEYFAQDEPVTRSAKRKAQDEQQTGFHFEPIQAQAEGAQSQGAPARGTRSRAAAAAAAASPYPPRGPGRVRGRGGKSSRAQAPAVHDPEDTDGGASRVRRSTRLGGQKAKKNAGGRKA